MKCSKTDIFFGGCTFLCIFVVVVQLRPHGLQHASLPCPSPTPKGCSNSCLFNQWCHPTIAFSVIPFSSCLQSFPEHMYKFVYPWPPPGSKTVLSLRKLLYANFLTVQWLGLHTSTAGGPGWMPDRGTKTPTSLVVWPNKQINKKQTHSFMLSACSHTLTSPNPQQPLICSHHYITIRVLSFVNVI